MRSRRRFIRDVTLTAPAVLAALRLGDRAIAAQAASTPAARPNPNFPQVPTWNTELRELAPNVYAYIQAGGPGRDNVSVSNAGLIVGDGGLMVIDSLAAPMHTRAFVNAIRKVSDKPFRHLLNTHHHSDHVNGNQYIVGAEIVGHPYCRDEVVKMIPGPAKWPKRDGWSDGTDDRVILPPVTTSDGKMTYYYAKNTVDVFPMAPAHTWGDLVVYLPQHKILFAGDVAFFYVAPFCQNAHPSKWIAWCQTVEQMDVDVIVPGHGPIGSKEELAEMRGYLELLKVEARKRFDAKMTPGKAAADIRMGKYENWIGPERIIMDTVRFYAEFAGTLAPPVDTEGIRLATEEFNSVHK
jgi:cyclase